MKRKTSNTWVDDSRHQFRAIDVANYLVLRSTELGKPISNILLQKVLYYAYVNVGVKTKSVLFWDSIEKWGYGPVIPNVYYEFTRHGSSDISEAEEVVQATPYESVDGVDSCGSITNQNMFGVTYYIYRFDNNKFVANIDCDIKNIIDDVLLTIIDNYYYNVFELVDATCNEPMWKKFEKDIRQGTHLEYKIDEIDDYANSVINTGANV